MHQIEWRTVYWGFNRAPECHLYVNGRLIAVLLEWDGFIVFKAGYPLQRPAHWWLTFDAAMDELECWVLVCYEQERAKYCPEATAYRLAEDRDQARKRARAFARSQYITALIERIAPTVRWSLPSTVVGRLIAWSMTPPPPLPPRYQAVA